MGRERGHVPRPTPWPLVDLTFLSRGASAPQFSLTADGFQIFCLSFVGKWSTELWFGSSHGKSTLPLAGDVRADLGPPFQDRGGGAEGAPLERAWQAPRGGGRMAAAPSCSPGWTGPSSGPMRRGRGRWSQMSSLPLPAGRGELSPSPCVEPGAWGWAPRLWNPCLGHTPPLPPSGLASSSEGASALPASGWGPNQGAGSCSPRDPYRSSLELSRGAWDSRSLFPHPTRHWPLGVLPPGPFPQLASVTAPGTAQPSGTPFRTRVTTTQSVKMEPPLLWGLPQAGPPEAVDGMNLLTNPQARSSPATRTAQAQGSCPHLAHHPPSLD